MSDMLPTGICDQYTWQLQRIETHNVPINKNLLGEVVRNTLALSRHA
jgi:hypothetical protein